MLRPYAVNLLDLSMESNANGSNKNCTTFQCENTVKFPPSSTTAIIKALVPKKLRTIIQAVIKIQLIPI
jgi:hypothetical protein